MRVFLVDNGPGELILAMQVQPLWSVFLASRSGREFSYSTASAIKKKKWRWKCSPGSDAALGMGISKGQIQTCPPDYSLPGDLYPHDSRVQAGLMADPTRNASSSFSPKGPGSR